MSSLEVVELWGMVKETTDVDLGLPQLIDRETGVP